MSRLTKLALSGTFLFIGLALGCSNDELEAKTNEQPCAVDADCAGDQRCVITAAETAAGITVGLCTTQTCVPGRQLGCQSCNPNTGGCGAPHAGYPTDIGCDANSFQCKFECEVDDPGTTDIDESEPCPNGGSCDTDADTDTDPFTGLCPL